MGILPRKEHPKPIHIEELAEITYADYVFDDSDDERLVIIEEVDESSGEELAPHQQQSAPNANAYMRTSTRRSARGEARKAVRQMARAIDMSAGEISVRKHMGARKLRRVANARILATLIHPDDICYDASDLVEEGVSTFARLMNDEKCMRLWNELIEKVDEEQHEFLKELGIDDASSDDEENEDALVEVNKYGRALKQQQPKERRQRHPAYSAESSFCKLDKRFKQALSKRQGVPLKLIEELEIELRKYFSTHPKEKWTANIANQNRRFYLHAVAQFLRLKSQSEPSQADGRITIITNPQCSFRPPDEPLHKFLNRSNGVPIK